MSIMNTNEIVPVENAFSQLANFNLDETLSQELDGLSLVLPRVKIPLGGITFFELPGENEETPDTVKEFTGVILCHHTVYAYYKGKYTGEKNPPDCGSNDGVLGVGNPGGECATCRYNQFGSGVNGSKACQNRRRLYILREGEIFPLMISLPSGSLKPFTGYVQRLLGKGLRTNAVLTKFTLKKAVNGSGLEYSQAQFAVVRKLTEAELPVVAGLAEQIKAYDQKLGFMAEEQEAFTDVTVNIDPNTGEIIG